VTVKNQSTYTRKWGRNKLIGSSIFQSAVQGTARDFLAHAALELDKLGFEIINLIHDEILMIALESEATQAEKTLLQVMSTPPSWAEGFPLAAETWVDKRYRK
jgi:DNA polymerase I-like protein with 3'-5' exonuclease and polymerase domains